MGYLLLFVALGQPHRIEAQAIEIANEGWAIQRQNRQFSLWLEGNTLAFVVEESDQDGRDLNGDGDSDDSILYVHDTLSSWTDNFQVDYADLRRCGGLPEGRPWLWAASL
jgi:hypothetical protein